MTSKSQTPLNLLFAATAAAVFSTPALAQPTGALEEVIVTAQKRSENLQDTAIAITAISGSMMDDLNITNSGDYEAIVPSLAVRDVPARLFIRGVGRVTNSLGTEPGIAVYTDGVYSSEIGVLGRSTSLNTQQLDVLRGPQGTLFGRNATGGAISVTSKRPTEEFENHVRATTGNYDQLDLGVSSSGPLTDDLGYFFTAYKLSRDGYIENNTGKDILDKDSTGLSAQLSWDATDRLNIWLKYAKDDIDEHTQGLIAQGVLITPYQPDAVTQDGFFRSEQFEWARENPTVKDPYKIDTNDVLHARNNGNNKYTAHVTWDLDNVTLKYIGSYAENHWKSTNGDVGQTANPAVRTRESSEQIEDNSSQEFQILSATDGALQWVAGLYYFHENKEQPYIAYLATDDYLENVVPGANPFDINAIVPNPGQLQVDQKTQLDTTSYAAYTDANYTFNETWKLTAGLRYTYDEKKGSESRGLNADPYAVGAEGLFPTWAALGFPSNCCGFLAEDPTTNKRKLDDDWDNVLGRIVLDYTPTDTDLIYASISNGYKAGGFNLGPLQPDVSFDQEELVSYEIGYKSTFADVLRLNAAAYFYQYDDMQVETTYLSPVGALSKQLVNAGESEVKGVELEATWLATDALTVMANYSYIDGEYTDFCCVVDTAGDPELGPQDLSGNPLTQAPKNKVYLNAAYAWQTDSMGEFVLSGSYSWVDERQYDAFNTDATLGEDYYRVDAMATWFSPSQDIRVILSGKNLTEEETYVSLLRLNAQGAVSGYPNAPRTYSMAIQYDF
jgi:iron complex outermembrane receptor protein